VANYWAFLYLAWIVPLVGMSLLTEGVPEWVPVPRMARRFPWLR
jgi:hypothetical protein